MIDITVRAELVDNKLIIPVKEYAEFIKPMLEKRNGVLSIRLEVPTKKKTSPENRLLHALIAQLAMYRETSLELMKRYVKVRACAHGYPYDMIEYEEQWKKRTIVEPKSVADASTVEVALLIETCYMIAGEWRVELKQEE
jgi:hypothetical protein